VSFLFPHLSLPPVILSFSKAFNPLLPRFSQKRFTSVGVELRLPFFKNVTVDGIGCTKSEFLSSQPIDRAETCLKHKGKNWDRLSHFLTKGYKYHDISRRINVEFRPSKAQALTTASYQWCHLLLLARSKLGLAEPMQFGVRSGVGLDGHRAIELPTMSLLVTEF